MAALELTYECNHGCIFCSNVWKREDRAYRTGAELTCEQWCGVASRLARLGVGNFCVTGGEPTLRADFGRIVRHLLEAEWFDYVQLLPRKCDVAILTNGDTDVFDTDEELCRLLATDDADAGGASRSVSVALHGAAARHAAVTGGGDVERTLRTMRTLVQRGVKVFANIVLGGDNGPGASAESDAVAAATLALEAGVRDMVLMRPMQSGRGCSQAARAFMGLSRRAVEQCIRAVSRLVVPRGGTVTLACCTPQCVFPEGSGDGDIEAVVVPRSCDCGKDTLCIDPAGFVRPCTTSEVVGGSALLAGVVDGAADDDFDANDPAALAVFSQEIRSFVEAARAGARPPVCGACAFSETCTAGCPSSHVDNPLGGRCDPLVLGVTVPPKPRRSQVTSKKTSPPEADATATHPPSS